MKYEALPLNSSPERAEVISKLLRGIAKTPTLFSQASECSEGCLESKGPAEMCEACLARFWVVTEVLGASTTIAFEVWASDELVGIIFYTNVSSVDATGHYVFFDQRLHDKTQVIKDTLEELQRDGRRITVEIPVSHVTLIAHAHRKLGFGGPFKYTLKGERHVKIEGLKRGGAVRDGRRENLVLLGLLPKR